MKTPLPSPPSRFPSFFPNIDVTTADKKNMEAGWNFSQYSVNESGLPAEGEEAIQRRLRSLPFMFDANGDIRYYLDLSRRADV